MDRINNNIKFYTFIDILQTYSDKNVSLSIKEINNHMKKRLGIVLDRRTIYNYMRDMKALGFDVSDYDKNKEGYYLNSHTLEPYEIKILSDAVLTSNFITKGKSLELLAKLKSFNSIYQNRDFIDNIFIEDIPKSTNEEIFSNMMVIDGAIKEGKKISFIDNIFIEDIPKSTNEEIFSNMMVIDGAIKEGKKIRFNYCNYDCFKRLVYRVDDSGERKVYVKSPVYLILRNKNYYLVCADESSKVLQNYRVDRMLNVSVMDEDIMDLSKFRDCKTGFNPMDYLRKSFKMFTGENAIVIVEFGQNLLNYFMDEFGEYIYIMEANNFSNNNLSEDVKYEFFEYKILEKILGKKEYNDYILTGKYMEDGYTRAKIEDFSRVLKKIIDSEEQQDQETDTKEMKNKIKDSADDDGGQQDQQIDNKINHSEQGADNKQSNLSNNYKAVDVDTDDNIKDKKYIGIFIAKTGIGLAKWILQFGADI
ncbi:MAG: helix-turn-helix transcriptional regulator, partial [Intestinibacter sp.]|uniref:helix-turn-helix transcriptional regulator n=1 Tax=Intestinibacter sp. TaxID=1965304 RepID=UPI003F17435F